MANDNDYIFGRLENEMKQIEEQKKLNAQKVKESEYNWLTKILIELGQAIGDVASFFWELLKKIFGAGK